MPDLSIVIPAYDEPENIRRLLPWIDETLPDIPHETIVVVPSGSDSTAAEVKTGTARVVVQEGPGYGGALRSGFAAAKAPFVLTMDADLSHEPTFIRDLYRRRDDGDVVIASRYVPFGHADMPWTRRVLSGILNLFFRVVLNLPVRDLSSGFRLYRRSFLDSLATRGEDFDVLEEILILAFAGGWRVLEAPFHYRPREAGATHARLFKFGVSYLKTTFRYWRLRNSLQSADHDARAFRSRNPVQRYWHRRRYGLLIEPLQGRRRVLDLGPSTSVLTLALPQSVVLDIGLKRLRHLRWVGRRVVRAEPGRLPFRDGAFDAVVCSQVIEHVETSDGLLASLAAALEPGGLLLVGVHDWGSPTWIVMSTLYRWLLGPEEDHHFRRLSPADLRAELEKLGLAYVEERRVRGWERIIVARKGGDVAPATPSP